MRTPWLGAGWVERRQPQGRKAAQTAEDGLGPLPHRHSSTLTLSVQTESVLALGPYPHPRPPPPCPAAPLDHTLSPISMWETCTLPWGSRSSRVLARIPGGSEAKSPAEAWGSRAVICSWSLASEPPASSSFRSAG